MHILHIKTHTAGRTYHGHHFFILSHGNNAGKPLDAPCPNCFVVFADSQEQKQQLYWLFYGLWQGKYFTPYIIGTVIPFIRLSDLKKRLADILQHVDLSSDQLADTIHHLQNIDTLNKNLLQQLRLIDEAKRACVRKLLGDQLL